MSLVRVNVLLDEPIATINPALHGHFAEHLGSCIEGGLWVGNDCRTIPHVDGLRRDVIDALRKIHPPVLRWPGGCFADDYHWRDGIGPRESRPRTVNLWWGHSIETNGFGTHEFINLCRLIGAEPYIGGNLGSGTVREMRDWVEYCNFPGDSTLARLRAANGSPQPFGVRMWGVGNETWGCGGNFCPEDYAAEYKRFATFLRDFGDTPLQLIACGPNAGEKDFHIGWTQRFFRKLGSFDRIHAFAAHYYCGTAGTATQYSTDQWYELLAKAARVEQIILAHRAAMDEFDRGRSVKLILDEWGTWHPPTPGRNPKHLWQQNTLRDALVAAITLDTFHRHADKLAMANIAQMTNVLQAMVLTDGDKMIVTPTYHVFDLYRSHRDGMSVRMEFEPRSEVSFAASDQKQTMPAVSGSASINHGALTLSLVNAHAALPVDIEIVLPRGGMIRESRIVTLSHDDITAHNTFDSPDELQPARGSVSDRRMTVRPASVTLVQCGLS